MTENKMTPAPWSYFLDGSKFTVTNSDKEYIVSSYSIRGDDGGYSENANVDSIVSAINNTYGKGINPEAVPDMLDAIKEFVRKVESGEAKSKRSYVQMLAAIERAKIYE